MSTRPSPSEFAPFYQGYIQLVESDTVFDALKKYETSLLDFYTKIPPASANYRYATNKWSLKEMLQHVLDTERIMSYRLLRIARNDQTPLAGFDENAYAAAANVDHRSWDSMVEEFRMLRQTTHALCHSLHEPDWIKMGTASGQPISVRALGFIVLGHLLHHKNIIVERYAAGPGMADFLSLV